MIVHGLLDLDLKVPQVLVVLADGLFVEELML